MPQGVKKPYNPILGEFFRTKWTHEDGTTTHYVAEQTSHHPPISSLYISNRKAGFVINGSIFPRSKFFRFSVASFLDGVANLTLLDSGEVYTITFPTVYGRGIITCTTIISFLSFVFVLLFSYSYSYFLLPPTLILPTPRHFLIIFLLWYK